MDVLVDGQANFELEGEPEKLIDVVGAISDFLRAQGRAMTSITVDGESILPEDLERSGDAPGQRPAAALQRIEVVSAPVVNLVEESLRELRDSLPDLPAACRSLAQIFHGEAPEEGFAPFHELAAIWGHVKERELMVVQALELDIEGMALEGQPVKSLHQELNEFLEEAAQAVADGDCILLGDLLEYELAPRAEQEARIVALLQEQAAAKSN